jgi:hypothetical protein
MRKNPYKYRRYTIQAKRKTANSNWTEWAVADNLGDAEKQRNRAEEAGYLARIIDRESKT